MYSVLSPFSSAGCRIRCGKAYSTRQFSDWKFLRCEEFCWLWHLGNCVAFTLPFSTCRCKTGNVFFHYIFVDFLKKKEMDFFLSSVLCGLFSDVLSFHGQKKRLLKKNSKVISTDAGWVCVQRSSKTSWNIQKLVYYLVAGYSRQMQTCIPRKKRKNPG